MFQTKNREYLMKMENFTQILNRILRSSSVFGLMMLALLFSCDSTAQTVHCPLACNNNVQVSMDLDCMVEITPDMMLEGQGTDPLCAYSVIVLDVNYNPIPTSPVVNSSHLGMTLPVSVELDQNSCWGFIKIEDKMPPVINCLDDITVDCYNNQLFPLPTATDNCSGSAIVEELSNDLDDSACNGDTTAVRTIRYQATDASGNKSPICERNIYYIKIGLGDIVFPTNKDDVEDPALECDINPNDNINPAWDTNGDGYPQPSESGVPETLDGFPIYPNKSICELNATYSDEVLPICESSFKVLREWVIMDWCTGTIERDYQIIKVVDDQGPIVTCLTDNQEVQADPHACTGTWIVPDLIEVFDCSSTSYEVGYIIADNNGNPPVNGVYIQDNVQKYGNGYRIVDLPVGRTWIRYTLTDACGNISYCFTEVDVVDNVPPVAVCDQFTVVTLTNNATTQGVASIFAQTFDDGSHDNCTEVRLDVRRMTPGCGQSTSQYTDRVNFCCGDVGRDIMVELRVRDDNDLVNTCMVNVEVQDKSQPSIECPEAITIECEVDYTDISITGEATAIDNCGTPTITHTDSGSPNQCGVGVIIRTFKAEISGASITCTQRITIENNDVFNSGDINWSGISDKTLDGCMDIDTDPSVTGRPTWNAGNCSLIAASYKDRTFTLVDSACFKILRTWTIIDWCEYNQNQPQSGGMFTRTQVIKLNNSVKPEFSDCSDKEADGYGVECDGYIELINEVTDDCTPQNLIDVSYRIDLDADGTYGPMRQGTNASGTYPVGEHKILWMAEDMCGNRESCEYYFTILDKKKPTPYCLSEITTVIMPSSEMIDIWAEDFDRGSFDNCPGDLKISFSADVNHTQEIFTCDDLGINLLEMWVTDAAGNSDYCTVRINIQSNGDACEGSRIGGFISTEDDRMVNDVAIALTNRTVTETVVVNSEESGEYQFGGMTSDNEYEIVAEKNNDFMNGVSTLDLVLIQRHILGVEEFESPYKIIASDVNNNEKVTASDLVELRKLILGLYTEFPNNDSWRFVNSKTSVSDMEDPWLFEENYEFMYYGEHMMDNNFVAVKVGDVNNTAKANLTDNKSEPRSNTTMKLAVNNVTYSAGDLIRIPVLQKEQNEILGFQFGIQFDNSKYEFVGIEAQNISMTNDNLGLGMLDQGIVNISWNVATKEQMDAEQVLFDVVLEAKEDGDLNGSIGIANRGIQAEAYTSDLEVMDVKIEVRSDMGIHEGVALYQNTPNPFDNTTTVRFTLPEAGSAQFKVVDITGRVLYNKTQSFDKGENAVLLSAQDLQSSGVLYYTLEFNGQIFTKKMILIRE
jgi:hypothetical protein